jgi:hypothetical protein
MACRPTVCRAAPTGRFGQFSGQVETNFPIKPSPDRLARSGALTAQPLGGGRAKIQCAQGSSRRHMRLRTKSRNSCSLAMNPLRKATNAITFSPWTESGTPITPASRTAKVAVQNLLHFVGRYVGTATDNDLFDAPFEPIELVHVAPHQVSGPQPAIIKGSRCGLRVLPISS